MVALCRHYIHLQKIYLAKAEADFFVMEERVKNILKKIGRDPSSISKPTIKSFCKNARKLKVRIKLTDKFHLYSNVNGLSIAYILFVMEQSQKHKF